MGIYRYCGDSQKGKSHETNGLPCQDSYFVMERGDLVFAAVADGLGSSKHSEIASEMAARSTVEFCANNIRRGMPDNDVISIIRKAFDNANFSIKQHAGDHQDDFDTTLTLAVFNSGEVYFGHAGDSGIIALRWDGLFEQVTEPQLGDGYGKERPVYPLAAESRWVFGKYKYRAKALFLMTDGVLNKAIPPLLEDQEYKLDHAYLYYLYDNLDKNRNLDTWVKEELTRIRPQEINYDDKSLLAIICSAVKLTLQPKRYYEFPRESLWKSLLEKHERELYPPIPPAPNAPPADARRVQTQPKWVNPANSHVQKSGAGSQQYPQQHPQQYPQQDNGQKSKLKSFVIVFAVGFVLGVIATILVTTAIRNISSKRDDKTPTIEVSEYSEASSEPAQDATPSLSQDEMPTPTKEVSTEQEQTASTEPAQEDSQTSISSEPPSPEKKLTGTAVVDNTTQRTGDEAIRIGDELKGSLKDGNNTGELSYIWMVGGDEAGKEQNYTVKVDDLYKKITLNISSSEETGLQSAETSAVAKIAAPDAPEKAPEFSKITNDSVTLVSKDGYQFSRDGINWQTDHIFTGLEPDTTYCFYQRIADTVDTEASAASPALEVETESD